MKSDHETTYELQCGPCDNTFLPENDLQTPIPRMHSSNSVDAISDIPQMDGNLSISSSVSGLEDGLSYPYQINQEKQVERLVQNTTKLPITIVSNSFKTVQGVQIATNVNAIFNAGVYLAAVKPALEAIHPDWNTVIGEHRIICSDISDRTDRSKALLVCTQVSLKISHKNDSQTSTKGVLNLYHIDDKVQVQGIYFQTLECQ